MVGRGVEGVCREGGVTGWRGRAGGWGCYAQGCGGHVNHAMYHPRGHATPQRSHDGVHCCLQALTDMLTAVMFTTLMLQHSCV